MLERCAWRHAHALCRFAHRDMFDPALFDDLDGHSNERLDEIAMMIGLGALCFLFAWGLGHGKKFITKG